VTVKALAFGELATATVNATHIPNDFVAVFFTDGIIIFFTSRFKLPLK